MCLGVLIGWRLCGSAQVTVCVCVCEMVLPPASAPLSVTARVCGKLVVRAQVVGGARSL